MGYELKTEDIYSLASSLNAEVKQKGDELFFKYCPYCQGGGHDKETFSINLNNGAFKCFRSSCGRQGHFVEMARDFNFRLEYNGSEKRHYRKLTQKEIISSRYAIEYLKNRGISDRICKRYKITTQKQKNNILVFPFYDDKKSLVCAKYRKTDFNKSRDKCKEWFEKDTMPILFGMAQCVDFETLVITEGQLDSLSLSECGVKNAVSVPGGCNNFNWINFCWDWILKFKEIIVFGDYENGKMTLLETISQRIPLKIKAVKESDYLFEKDANDILRKYGKKAVLNAVENADVVPVSHVKQLADVENVNLDKLPKIKSGMRELDKIIGGMFYGQVVLVTGKRGEGKSTLTSMFVVNAIEQEQNVFIYSGELPNYHFKNWLDLQIAGEQNIKTYTNEYMDCVSYIDNETSTKINDWYRDKAYIYDNSSIDSNETVELLKIIEQSIQRYNIKLVLIDNLMTALDVDLSADIYRAQSNFLKALKNLAIKYNVVVLLVAHPRKNVNGSLENDDISGSSDITNRVDVVIAFKKASENEEADGYLSVIKNRLTGRITQKDRPIQTFYNPLTKRICTKASAGKNFSWNKKDELKDFINFEEMV